MENTRQGACNLLQLAQNQMNQPSMGKLNCADCEGTSDWIPCKISHSNESSCYVTCPLCKQDLVQCRLCTYNFIENNNPVLINNRRSPEGYMMRHLKQKRNIAAQKRQKTSGGCKVTGASPIWTQLEYLTVKPFNNPVTLICWIN